MADLEESGSSVGSQVAEKDPQYPHKPVYCPSCSLPPDYCIYSENFAKCKPWLLKNYPNLYPDLVNDPAVSSLVTQIDGVTIINDNIVVDEPSEPTGGKKGKKAKDEGPLEIVISSVARTKRKFVTNITGLSRAGLKLADCSKIFAKKFAASSSVTPDKDEIVIQGDIVNSLSEFLIKQWPEKINKSIVFVEEDGKRRRMD